MKGRNDDSGSTERDDFSLGLRDICAVLYQLQEAGFIVPFIFILNEVIVPDNIIQLSPEGEVNSGGYIPRR